MSPSAKGFLFIPQHQKGYRVYATHKRKIISSYGVVFYESLYSALAYKPQTYAEAMAMRTAMSYIPYATSPKEQTGHIITFAHFEEGGLLSKTRNDMESSN